jgi:putative ABC transport system ATP-binding protein
MTNDASDADARLALGRIEHGGRQASPSVHAGPRPRDDNGRMSTLPTPDVATATSPPVAAAGAIDAVKIYGHGNNEVRALDGVTVTFAAGAYTAIMGPSGSGKSTLMHCLAGLDSLTSGAVFVGETYLATLDDKALTRLRRDKIGFIFQAYNLLPTLTAAENMTLPLALGGHDPDQGWYDQVVTTVGLKDRLTHRPSELSGGQQQRVAVGRALVTKPQIIFADEPTGNLDSRSGAEILTFMRQAVNELGQTIVMVTHDPNAASYADRVIFLGDGKIVDEMQAPTADRVLDRLKQFGD